MIYEERMQDLFTVSDEYYLVHCISGDYALGAGIAKTFDKKMDMKFKLFRDYPIPNGHAYANVGKALLIDHRVFNLVTKNICWSKPTYQMLQMTLLDMKAQCEELGVKKLAMPLIGCGLDKLEWSKVSTFIQAVFDDTDIEILVCKI